MVWILDNIVKLGELFGDVATSDPISGVLLALGAVLTAFASVAFGYLSARGLADAIIPSQLGRAPPQRD